MTRITRGSLNGTLVNRKETQALIFLSVLAGIVLGVVVWWVVLYGSVFAVSVFTEDVGWSQAGVVVASVGVLAGCVVWLVREREARPLLVGVLVGWLGFWVFAALR